MERRNTRRHDGRARAVRLSLVALSLCVALPLAARAQDAAEFDYAAQPLRVGVWLDRAADEVYRKGDPLTVGFETNEDAYAVAYRIDTEGRVTVLWPRSRMDDGFVFGGHEYVLPVTGAPQLRVGTSEGEGFVQVICSRYPFDLRALELDFHHERGSTYYDYRVVGDPFLAMNEVNFAVTGLEDAGDYVVTNYASYYVHRAVEHPRYLCNQCHFEEDVAYDPYRDTCQLNITVDYRWSNAWWGTYGYYPVYYNPCYVYVDPWSWGVWVNFWYDPWWSCPPVSVCYWPYNYGVWCNSAYYRGNCWSPGYAGTPRYRPLAPGPPADGTRTKTREYGRVTPMLASRDGGAGRGASTAVADGRTKRTLGAGTAYRGEERLPRERPDFGDATRTRGTAGLRIREDGVVAGARGGGAAGGAAEVRHRAGGGETRSKLVPVTGGGSREVGRSPGVRSDAAGRDGGSRAIRPVEPRQKGTRIWNTGRTGGADDRMRRPEQVRPGSGTRGGGEASRDNPSRVRDGGNSSRDRSRSSESGGSVKPRSRSGGDSKATRNGGGRSGGGSSVRKAPSGGQSSGGRTPRSGSSGGSSRSSGSRGGGSSRGGAPGTGR